MTNPMIRIHNTEIDEIIDREMTDEEFEKYKIDVKNTEIIQAEREAKIANKQSGQAKLAELGLTADEIAALGN